MYHGHGVQSHSHPVQPNPVHAQSHPAHSLPLQPNPVHSHPVQSNPVHPHSAQMHPSQSHTALSHTEQSHTTLSHNAQSHTSLPHTALSHTAQSHAEQSHTTLSHTVQSHTAQSHTVQHGSGLDHSAFYSTQMQAKDELDASQRAPQVEANEAMAYERQQRERAEVAARGDKMAGDETKNDPAEGDSRGEGEGDTPEDSAESMWFPAVTLEIKEDQSWDRPSTSDYFPPDITGSVRVFVCNNCYETFRELATLRQHLLANKGVCCFICERCGKLFETMAALRVHEIVHADSVPSSPCEPPVKLEERSSSAGPPTYRPPGPAVSVAPGRGCVMYAGSSKCDATTLTDRPPPPPHKPPAPRVSARTHNANRPFPCTVAGCSRSYLSKSHLLGHIKEAHAVGYTFACDICNRRFQRNATLKRHTFLVHVKKTRDVRNTFECEVCEKTFHRNATLKRHKMLVHVKVAYPPGHVFECEICNKRFRRNSTLKRHKTLVHSETCDDRPFICQFDDCGKHYKHKHHLKAHILKHCDRMGNRIKNEPEYVHANKPTDKRPSDDHMFACDVCEKSFQRNYTLTRHKMLVHSGSGDYRPFVCDFAECGKSYKLKYHLKDHMQKHSKISMLRY